MSKLIEEKEVFKCCRFNVVERHFERDDGVKYGRFSVNPGDAVIVLPVTKDNEIIFIEQMRETVGKVCLELPAGMIDEGEKPAVAAKRELEEETGFIANDIELMLDGYPSAGYTSEKMYIYIAKDLEEGKVHLDDTEEILSVRKIPIEEVMELVAENYFDEVNVVVAILMFYQKYCSNK